VTLLERPLKEKRRKKMWDEKQENKREMNVLECENLLGV
jgi:hypothetical protein